MTTAQDKLLLTLRGYIDSITNGILQHSEEWHAAKKYTIGGSQMSTIQGVNSFGGINELIGSKLGYNNPTSIHMNWGNLFEDVIKGYCEIIYNTEIMGDNIFIQPENSLISYSPDGLGVIGDKIVLFEFKCPCSRIPASKPPKYYIPQVKTGLEIIPIADYGVLIEAVFRRCKWPQMGLNDNYDTTIVDKKIGTEVLACGFVGFYCDLTELYNMQEHAVATNNLSMMEKLGAWCSKLENIDRLYSAEYNIGNAQNNYSTNDLGVSSEKLFEALLDGFNTGIIKTWYSKIIIDTSDNAVKQRLNVEFATYECLMTAIANAGDIDPALNSHNILNYGILPWKLFHIKQHTIDKTPGYLEPWKEKIAEVINTVKICDKMSPESRRKYYDSVINAPQYTII
jgi:hypothetical protein